MSIPARDQVDKDRFFAGDLEFVVKLTVRGQCRASECRELPLVSDSSLGRGRNFENFLGRVTMFFPAPLLFGMRRPQII